MQTGGDAALSLAQALSPRPDVMLGIALTCIGSTAIIGGALVTYGRRWKAFSNTSPLALALALASGTVLCCALDELLPEAQRALERFTQSQQRTWISPARASACFIAACAFVLGAVFAWTLDTACQSWAACHLARHHHEMRCEDTGDSVALDRDCVVSLRTKLEEEGTVKMDGNSSDIHNLIVLADVCTISTSEMYHVGIAKILGFATQSLFVGAALAIATMQAKALGVSLGVAVALMNIAVSMALARFVANVPGMRWRAVQWCVVASFSLPLGGSIASCIAVMVALHPLGTGAFLAGVSGMLACVCLTQMLPACTTHASTELPRICCSVVSGIVMQSAVRSILELTLG